jgi:tetratricopeptide (TPR) repeat protein
MTMPQRPRSHVLEELSRTALRRVLPAEWIVTFVEQDYGIDARVEVFNDGLATGLAFWVQLKATDEPDLHKALRVSFEVTTLNYMSAQADPVLLVRLHAPSGELYVHWLHHDDVVLKTEAQKTFRISWAMSDRLDRAEADTLQDEVRRFRRFSSPPVGALSVRLDLPADLEASRTVITMLLTSVSASTGGLLTFTGDAPHDITIKITANMLHVHMSLASIRIETLTSSTPPQVAENILVASAVCLARLGRPDVATSLVLDCPRAPLLGIEAVAERLAPAFGTAGRWRSASDLVLTYRADPEAQSHFATMLQLDTLFHAADIPADDARHIAGNLVLAAQGMEERGEATAGAAYYTAGNFLFCSVHDYPNALAAYESAARTRPDYLEQSYYLAETAAAHFEVGHYEAAAQMYGLALAAGDGLNSLACKADCLSHAGQQNEALRLFEQYVDEDPEPAAHWRLKLAALRALRDSGCLTPEQFDLIPLENALDALGRVDGSDDRGPAAALAMVTFMCAFPAADFDEPWVFLLLLAHRFGDDQLFAIGVEAAWQRVGERVVIDVASQVAATDGTNDEFLATFHAEVDKQRAQQRSGFTLRLLHDDGVRDELIVSTDPDNG